MSKFRNVVFRGTALLDYLMDDKGFIYSTKNGGWKKLSTYLRNGYPATKLFINGKPHSTDIHRLVAETIIPIPLPDIPGVKLSDWKNVPQAIIKWAKNPERYCVNHIDHNKENFHPSNLEWVSVRENSHKYQEHRKKAA